MLCCGFLPTDSVHIPHGYMTETGASMQTVRQPSKHDDVIKWKHFPRCWPFVQGNSPVPGEFPAQRPVTRSFDVFFDLRLNKRLSKEHRRRWFETPSRSLWGHCNGLFDRNWGKHADSEVALKMLTKHTLRARFMGPTWGSSRADRTQVGPLLAPWTLLSGYYKQVLVDHEEELH